MLDIDKIKGSLAQLFRWELMKYSFSAAVSDLQIGLPILIIFGVSIASLFLSGFLAFSGWLVVTFMLFIMGGLARFSAEVSENYEEAMNRLSDKEQPKAKKADLLDSDEDQLG